MNAPRHGVAVVTLLVIAALSACVLFGKTYQMSSDARGTLLVSQSLIEHGTVRVDAYHDYFGNYGRKIIEKDGHFYYDFPLGTPIVAVPFVATAKLLGANMTVIRHDAMTQLLIAATALLLTFLVMQRIACLYLEPLPSAVLAAAFLFGTSFVSTGMTALWSHDFAALFALLAIYSLLRAKATGRPARWYLMAFFLFMAYLCRPTMLLLSPIVVAIQFIYIDRKSALKLTFALLLLAAAFVAFSWQEFRQLLPDYYLPKRLAGGDFWLALYGNLASPARGLLVFSPFLLLPTLFTPYLWKKYPSYRAELGLVVWPVLHLLAISKFPHWWAGWSYGPRLMYDVLPALFVVLVIFWRSIDKRSIAAGFTSVAAVFAVAVNLGQGIFNPYTASWNAAPAIDSHPDLLFNWEFPQFLHNAEQHEQRIAEERALEAIKLNASRAKLNDYKQVVGNMENVKASLAEHRVSIDEQYDFASDALVFLNWGVPESEFRWSDGYYAEIVFIPDTTASSATSIHLQLHSITPQNIRVLLNGTKVGTFAISHGAASLDIDIRNVLKPDEVNLLQFELPGAMRASDRDARILSVAVKSLSFARD